MSYNQFGQFVTPGNRQSPPMMVTVTQGKKEIKTYRTPAGFRLEQFVASQHQDKTVKVTFPVRADGGRPDFQVDVIDENGNEVERHLGVYDKVDV